MRGRTLGYDFWGDTGKYYGRYGIPTVSGKGKWSSNSILRLKKLRETQPKKPYTMVNGWAGQPVE